VVFPSVEDLRGCGIKISEISKSRVRERESLIYSIRKSHVPPNSAELFQKRGIRVSVALYGFVGWVFKKEILQRG
jgi:hypothetical protein